MRGLPSSWTVEPFSSVARYAAGRTPSRANPSYWAADAGAVPWVSISDMENYGTVARTAEVVSEAAVREVFRGRIVPAGTLLMSFKLTIGRVATLGVPGYHNEAIISIFPRSGVDQRYLGYYLSQVDYEDHQDRQIKGNTLNQSKIDQIEVALPPSEVQVQIADVLDCCRLGIDTEREAEKAARELKAACMAAMFSQGTYREPVKESVLGPIPNSWQVKRLSELGRIGNGTTPNRQNPEYWNGGTVPWITSGRMYERRIRSSDVLLTKTAIAECSLPMLEPGAVLIAIVGQGKTLGHCALLEVQATVSRHVGFVQPRQDLIHSNFLIAYLEYRYELLRQLASGNGSTRAALTGAILRELDVPVPSLDEQAKIANLVEQINEKIELHRRKRVVLEELFKAVLQKLMTGEIDVNDLDLSALQPAT